MTCYVLGHTRTGIKLSIGIPGHRQSRAELTQNFSSSDNSRFTTAEVGTGRL